MKVKLSKLLRWKAEPKAGATDPGSSQLGNRIERRESPRFPVSGRTRVFGLVDGRPFVRGGECVDGSEAGGLGLRIPLEFERTRHLWLVTSEGWNFPFVVAHTEVRDGELHVGGKVAERFATEPVEKPGWTATCSWIGDTDMLMTHAASIRNVGEGRLELMSIRTPPCPSLVLIGGAEYGSLSSTVETRLHQDQPVTVVDVLETFEIGAQAA